MKLRILEANETITIPSDLEYLGHELVRRGIADYITEPTVSDTDGGRVFDIHHTDSIDMRDGGG